MRNGILARRWAAAAVFLCAISPALVMQSAVAQSSPSLTVLAELGFNGGPSIVQARNGRVVTGGRFVVSPASGLGGFAVLESGRWATPAGWTSAETTEIAIDPQSRRIFVANGSSIRRIDGDAVVALPALPFTVTALHWDEVGQRLLVGGNGRVASWNGSAWTSWALSSASAVRSIAVRATDGSPFVGMAGGAASVHRFDGTAWVAVPDLTSGTATELVWSPTLQAIVATGGFTLAGGQPAGGIAALGSSGWTPLLPPRGPVGGAQYQWSSARWDSFRNRLLVADTNAIYALSGSELRKLESAGQPQGPIIVADFDVDPQDGRVYAVGPLGSSPNGTPRGSIAVWDDTAWQAIERGNLGGHVGEIAVDTAGNRLFVEGDFSSIGGATSPGLAMNDGQSWRSLTPPPGGAAPWGSIWFLHWDPVGRELVCVTTEGGVRRFWRLSGSSWLQTPLPQGVSELRPIAFDPAAGEMYAISSQREVFAGRSGSWRRVAQHPTHSLGEGAWDAVNRRLILQGTNSAVTPYTQDILALDASGAWSRLGSIVRTRDLGTGELVEDIAVNPVDGRIAVVGNFEAVSGVPASSVAVLEGGQWRALATGANGQVRNAAWSGRGDFLTISGPFTSIGGLSSGRFAVWARGAWTVPFAGTNGWVNEMQPDRSSGGVLMSGALTLPGGPAASLGVLDVSAAGPVSPNLRIEPLSVPEGDSGESIVTMKVALDTPAPSSGVSVAWRTESGSATAGEDFISASGTASIAQGALETSISIRVIGDRSVELDEFLRVVLGPAIGATIGQPEAQLVILNDDRSGVLPSLAARPDRFDVVRPGESYTLDVLRNDAFESSRIRSGSLSVVDGPTAGRASVWSPVPGDGDASDDKVVLTVPAGENGPIRFRYRLCEETAGRCSEADVEVDVRPWMGIPRAMALSDEAGFRDIEAGELPALQGAMFEAFGLVAPRRSVVDVPADPTPEQLWDGGGTTTLLRSLAALPDGAAWRVFVDVLGENVDVHLGVDTNGDGSAQPNERLCSGIAAATAGDRPGRCEFSRTVQGSAALTYWILLHRRATGTGGAVTVESFDVRVDQPTLDRTLRATGPAVVANRGTARLRLSWDLFDSTPGESRGGWIRVAANNGTYERWWPVRIDGPSFGPQRIPLSMGVSRPYSIGQTGQVRQFMLDVPSGPLALDLGFSGGGEYDVRVVRDGLPGESAQVPAIPTPQPSFPEVARTSSLNGRVGITVSSNVGGRYWISVTSRTAAKLVFNVDARLSGAASGEIAPGGYFNALRSGHGLFIYPAGRQMVALWYTYDQQGQPTWYYLQGEGPASTGVWRGALYRSVWLGARNVLTAVGEGIVTPLQGGDVVFTYSVDGEYGTERLAGFGSGCPSVGGAIVDSSGHWFDPSRAGTGYSAQFFAGYEFHAVFAYDAEGRSRFLVAEGGAAIAADRTLNLEQLQGFCPLCVRSIAPARTRVGTLARSLEGTRLKTMLGRFSFASPLRGSIDVLDNVTPLGATQGCR
jgi:hypothetical protein